MLCEGGLNCLKIPPTFIHTPVKDGGLGVAVLKNAIPLMKKVRLEKLLVSSDPTISAVARSSFFLDALRKVSVPQTVAGIAISNKQVLKWALAYGLHNSVDEHGLESCSHCPRKYSWLTSPSRFTSGANYIGAVKIRGNLMPTAAWMACGHPERSRNSDACLGVETLGHIVQQCPRIYAARVDLHDKVVGKIVKALMQNQWHVLVEPTINMPPGIRRHQRHHAGLCKCVPYLIKCGKRSGLTSRNINR